MDTVAGVVMMMPRRREFPLTVADQEMIDGLDADGLDVAQIARQLQRSKRSIAYYLRHRKSTL